MSHFSKITTTIRDIEMLKLALKDLGLVVNSSVQSLVGYQLQTHNAQIVINQTNNCDFGFSWNGSEYELIVDAQYWCQPWSIDAFVDKLTQSYAYNSITKEGSNFGFEKVDQKLGNDGAIKLTFQRWID
nr:Ycf35 [Erythrocladia irregularis]